MFSNNAITLIIIYTMNHTVKYRNSYSPETQVTRLYNTKEEAVDKALQLSIAIPAVWDILVDGNYLTPEDLAVVYQQDFQLPQDTWDGGESFEQ